MPFEAFGGGKELTFELKCQPSPADQATHTKVQVFGGKDDAGSMGCGAGRVASDMKPPISVDERPGAN